MISFIYYLEVRYNFLYIIKYLRVSFKHFIASDNNNIKKKYLLQKKEEQYQVLRPDELPSSADSNGSVGSSSVCIAYTCWLHLQPPL